MAGIYKNVGELIGKTPLMEVGKIEKNFCQAGRLESGRQRKGPDCSADD